jgi:hypothetical protein
MFSQLDKYLLSAQGKRPEEIPLDNPYREFGFDKDKNRLGWLRVLPFSVIKEAFKKLSSILEGKEIFIFVGMGGSINGIKALLPLFKKCPLYTLDSLDPQAIKDILEKIKGKTDKTLVVAISKSGTTQETQLLAYSLRQLYDKDWQEHFLWLADNIAFAKLGSLGWQQAAKVPIQFDAESDIGGRFSSPHTLIFFLPLFILLNRDFEKLRSIYEAYLVLQPQIRQQAYSFAEKNKDNESGYFFPQVKGNFSDKFSSWIVQVFQESLGSKKESFAVKTSCSPRTADSSFSPLSLDLKIKDPVVSLIAQMYFFQAFIAFYAAFKKVNFVDQDFVEKYKEQMRRLISQKGSDIETLSLKEIIEEVKKRVLQKQKFIEVVLYFYLSGEEAAIIAEAFNKRFKDKKVFVFAGSDWNHHSYQAAFSDKNTFYVLLPSSYYISQADPISKEALLKNAETLKLISQATYLTLKDKAVLFSLSR